MGGEAAARRGLWARVMSFLGWEDEDLGEEEARPGAARRLVSLPGGRRGTASGAAREAASPGVPGLALYRPLGLEEARAAADRLRRRQPVVVQLDRAEREEARRILDFLAGTVYALEGSLYNLGGGTYLAAPGGVAVSDLRGE